MPTKLYKPLQLNSKKKKPNTNPVINPIENTNKKNVNILPKNGNSNKNNNKSDLKVISKPKVSEKNKKHRKNEIKYLYFDKLLYSPFDFPTFKEDVLSQGYEITKDPKNAHIILSSYFNNFGKYNSYGTKKKYLLWTHEPYHDFHYQKLIKDKGINIHIMNVYTKDIFTNNYRYFHYNKPLKLLDPKNFPYESKKIKVCALSTKYPSSYYQKNKYTTLPKRYEIIEWGYQHGILDIYGKGWKGKEIQNSRNAKDKEMEKSKILKNYHFNLALENTDFPFYVTEKIWEPITNYNLPIYYSNSTIYRDFPKESFIDYRDFQEYKNPPEKLFEFIRNMTKEEFVQRMNRCITTFNEIVQKHPNKIKKCPSNNNLSKVDYSNCTPYLIKKLKTLT